MSAGGRSRERAIPGWDVCQREAGAEADDVQDGRYARKGHLISSQPVTKQESQHLTLP